MDAYGNTEIAGEEEQGKSMGHTFVATGNDQAGRRGWQEGTVIKQPTNKPIPSSNQLPHQPNQPIPPFQLPLQPTRPTHKRTQNSSAAGEAAVLQASVHRAINFGGLKRWGLQRKPEDGFVFLGVTKISRIEQHATQTTTVIPLLIAARPRCCLRSDAFVIRGDILYSVILISPYCISCMWEMVNCCASSHLKSSCFIYQGAHTLLQGITNYFTPHSV